MKSARAAARANAWAAGAAPPAGTTLAIDIDATITIDHSDNKENAAATWKHTYGYHPLLAFLDRPDISAGEALAGLLRPGNAGSNTTADHITVLEQALAALPAGYRPDPAGAGQPDTIEGTQAPKVLVHRFRRRHPRLRQGLPDGGCRVLVRVYGDRVGETGGYRAGRGGRPGSLRRH